jgi:hypothetical protein
MADGYNSTSLSAMRREAAADLVASLRDYPIPSSRHGDAIRGAAEAAWRAAVAVHGATRHAEPTPGDRLTAIIAQGHDAAMPIEEDD